MHTFFELLKVGFLATLYIAFVPRLMAIGTAPRENPEVDAEAPTPGSLT